MSANDLATVEAERALGRLVIELARTLKGAKYINDPRAEDPTPPKFVWWPARVRGLILQRTGDAACRGADPEMVGRGGALLVALFGGGQ